MEKVKIGFIGCGWIVENAHIPAFLKQKNSKLAAVFDIEFAKAERLAKKYAIKKYYDNFDNFLESDIEAVIVATPNYSHSYYSLKSLSRGIHVLCEKPVAISTNELLSVIEMARKMKKVFLPGYVNRFRPDILKIKELILGNELGEIREIEAGWLRKSGIPRPGSWFTNKKYSGGGVLIDIGTHILDICLMLIGEQNYQNIELKLSQNNLNLNKTKGAKWFQQTANMAYTIDVEDTAIAKIVCDRNLKIEVKLSWAAPVKADSTYIYIWGPKARLELKTLFGFSNDRLWEKDSLEIIDNRNNELIRSYNLPDNKAMVAFENLANCFVNVIMQKETCLSDHEALKVVSIIEQLYNTTTEK